MKNYTICVIALFILPYFAGRLSAATVDTLTLQSKSLGKETKVVVILPDSYNARHTLKYPVVYLLHGYTGNFSDWVKNVPSIKEYADRYQCIIVCPDGENSWYIDSKVMDNSNYSSYSGAELPLYINKTYRTYKDRNQTAITGLSMGGHGALYLAMNHEKTFGAAGSMSGALDISSFGNHYNIGKIVGDTTLAAVGQYACLQLVSGKDINQKIVLDCGIEDIFIHQNRAMHNRLMELSIPHDYTERPGGHTWDYWKNAIEYQLLFFRRFFDEKNG